MWWPAPGHPFPPSQGQRESNPVSFITGLPALWPGRGGGRQGWAEARKAQGLLHWTGVMLSRPIFKLGPDLLLLVAGSPHGSSPPVHPPSSSSWRDESGSPTQWKSGPLPPARLSLTQARRTAFLGFPCFPTTPGLGTRRVDRKERGSRAWQVRANPSPATCCWIILGKRRNLPEPNFLP